MLVPWLRLASDTTLLALEAQTVIGLRLGQIAMGRGSLAENQLMVTEKLLRPVFKIAPAIIEASQEAPSRP